MTFAKRMALVGSLIGAAVADGHMGWNATTTAASTEYTTEIVTELTTYCPSPTTITHGTNTYTVTEATTLTITDCPCTVTHPIHPPPPHTEYTTEIVTELTTYCPAPTTITHGNSTYTVTEPTTLTITDCPCTVTHPIPPPEITYTTEIVTELTTYCPAPTTITHGNSTYTMTEPGTLTITDCPCTVTHPIPPPGTPENPDHPDTPAPPPPSTMDTTAPTQVPPPSGTTPPETVETAGAAQVAPFGAAVALGLFALF